MAVVCAWCLQAENARGTTLAGTSVKAAYLVSVIGLKMCEESVTVQFEPLDAE